MNANWLSVGAQIVLMLMEHFLNMKPKPSDEKLEAVRELRRAFRIFVTTQRHNNELIEQVSWAIIVQSQALRANTEAIKELTETVRQLLADPHGDKPYIA